ncbi:MAG: asparaginase [Calditrichaeota bacterium]|nr:MAG: asparaginase [Calditrichota bacterium]MBL1204433.1 asparaginase [Calditrichota bacterium]NOG44262.1 asparaginase [Calditrichota bacterium]
MKKILVLHTGGTFGMMPMEPDQTLTPGNLQHELLERVPEIAQIAEINVQIPFNEDSSDLSIKEWDVLAEIINSNMNTYDGFVIIHGTDTMVFTAAALSYSLLNLNKPVILTGAQRPLSKLRSDARLNLIDAIEVATYDIGEVVIVFGQHILRGNRSRKTSITSYDAFYSPNYPPLGEIGLNVEPKKSLIRQSSNNYQFSPGFDSSVISIHIFPNCDPGFYRHTILDKNIRAIMLIGFGAGNIPMKESEWLVFIKDAVSAGKAVFINSSSSHGKVNLQIYESGQKVMDAGAIGCVDMTIEASVVKIMKSLALSSDTKGVKNYFLKNIAGEIED